MKSDNLCQGCAEPIGEAMSYCGVCLKNGVARGYER